MKQHLKLTDATYAYTDVGTGEPLLLLHGFTSSTATWDEALPFLAKKYRVIALDLPGHGETIVERPRSMKRFAEDLQQITKMLGLDTFHLLGYSLGGRSALSYAMYFPGNIRTLILESASPGLKTAAERNARQEQDEKLAQMILQEGVAAFVTYWSQLPLFQTQLALPQHVQEKVRQERLAQTPKGLSSSLRYMGTGQQPSWWEQLQQCTFPVLLIVGEKDAKFVKINREMHSLFKQAQLEIVPSAGHAVHLEQVEKFVTIVMEFLAKHS